MIPPDTSMPVYDSPLSPWPGVFTLALGLLIFLYLIAQTTRNYRRARSNEVSQTPQTSTKPPETQEIPQKPTP